MGKSVVLEIFAGGQWHVLGEVGFGTRQVAFEYALEYLDTFVNQLDSRAAYAASVQYPLNYMHYSQENWPAFLFDLLPTGAARQNWLRRLDLANAPSSDIELLARGAINPPGNIRVKSDIHLFVGLHSHGGFDYEEVVKRGVDFVSYAESLGAIVSGTSGAQGEAPKFLLVEDNKGKWHGDGALKDSAIKKSWLVKYPRGKKTRDYQILQCEQLYYELASDLGAKVMGPLKWDRDTLFIPRFDRERESKGKLHRRGLESLVSAMGVGGFGIVKNHEDYLLVIKKYSTDPSTDLKEYVFRDFLNIITGNTDNHGRNTALIKSETEIRLSPLYDFAPMVLDDSAIPRVSKWKEESFHIPNFSAITSCLVELGVPREETMEFLRKSKERLSNVVQRLETKGMPPEILELATRKYDDFMKSLEEYLGRP